MKRTAEPLDVDALREAVVGPWTQLDVVAETGSTNADLLAAAAEGLPDRCVLTTEFQSAGRGRMTRGWVNPAGTGIAVSVLLRPTGVPASRFGWLPLVAGLAVLDTVRACGVTDAGLKWPNDCLVGRHQRKVAGILAEVADQVRPAIVLGIGMNVAAAPPDQPFATCLADVGVTASRTEVLSTLLLKLAEREDAWRAARGDAEAVRLHADYRSGCASLGSEVRVELPGGGSIVGIAEDVDRDGRLLLLDAAGRRRAVAAGDVVHVRPADRVPPRD
jgi:BirA family biotin operon repressor/biotin-[acetyl-CoA-carboxylase] ligase